MSTADLRPSLNNVFHIGPMKDLPILNSCSWVFAAADANHDGGEQEEEAGHGEAHTVHRLVAHKGITVSHVVNSNYTSTSLAKSWDLWNTKESDKIIMNLSLSRTYLADTTKILTILKVYKCANCLSEFVH